jgi:hypothetical protein
MKYINYHFENEVYVLKFNNFKSYRLTRLVDVFNKSSVCRDFVAHLKFNNKNCYINVIHECKKKKKK